MLWCPQDKELVSGKSECFISFFFSEELSYDEKSSGQETEWWVTIKDTQLSELVEVGVWLSAAVEQVL